LDRIRKFDDTTNFQASTPFKVRGITEVGRNSSDYRYTT